MTEEHVEVDRPKAPEGPNLLGAVDHYFGLGASGTTVPTELRAGLATFAWIRPAWSMAPCSSRPASPQRSTAVMGLYANYPIALAPGMELSPWCSRFCWSCFSTRRER